MGTCWSKHYSDSFQLLRRVIYLARLKVDYTCQIHCRFSKCNERYATRTHTRHRIRHGPRAQDWLEEVLRQSSYVDLIHGSAGGHFGLQIGMQVDRRSEPTIPASRPFQLPPSFQFAVLGTFMCPLQRVGSNGQGGQRALCFLLSGTTNVFKSSYRT